ncbi:MAG: hypothetical protein ACOCQX_04015 [Candidatus Nanoarchaeia archaeon]
MALQGEISLLILFVGMVLSAALTFYFAIKILRATAGSNKGWLFYGLFGIANAINSFAGIARSIVSGETANNFVLVIQSLLMLGLTVFLVLALTILAEVFGIKSKVFSRNNILIATGIALVGLIVYANSFAMASVYSITSITFGIGLFLTVPTIWKIMTKTGQLPWKFLFASHIIAMIAIYLIFGAVGCCSGAITENCPNLTSNEYLQIPAPCSPFFVGGYTAFLIVLMVSTFLQAGAFYIINKRLN